MCAEVMLRLHRIQLQYWFETMRTAALSQTKGLTPFLTVTSTRYLGKVPKEESEIRAVLRDCTTPGSGNQQFWNLLRLHLHLDYHA